MKPEKCLCIHALDGFETYKMDENTIGVRPIWFDVMVRKPTPSDSPILAVSSLNHFSARALEYTDGWDGDGWYDTSHEYGMGLNEGEAHYHEYEGMKYWMPLPKPPGSSPVKDAYWKICECALCLEERSSIIARGAAEELMRHQDEMIRDLIISSACSPDCISDKTT